MRLFEHFPKNDKCPICNRNDDKPCFLIPIDGTQKDNICKALPVHASCVSDNLDKLILNKEVGIIYMRIGEGSLGK